MARNQNYDVNYKLRGLLLNGQGGDIVGDLTELEQRILLLEQNKQDNLIAGQGIIFSGNTISAQNIIDDTRNSSTTVWSSNKVKSIVESFEGGVNVVIVDSRPSKSAAIEKTMYYVGNNAPYHIWFFLDNNYVDFGTTEISLENYYTKLEIDNLLGLKVDKEEGKVLIPLEDLEQITTNKNDISDLDSSKVDKEEGKTLISSEDLSQISLNKINIANLGDQKVDKVSGKSLVSNVDIAQITTNKNDISDLKSDKVDKVSGKSLVFDSDITQITTNKNDIATLNTGKQDKITDSTLSSLSDSTTVSSVSASSKTNKTFALSALWTYIKGKITGAISSVIDSDLTASRALVSSSAGKIGVSSVTSTELGKLSGVTNTLKLETFTGNSAFTFTGADVNLQSLADWDSNIPRKAWKMNGVVGLSFHLKCNCTYNISGGWIYLGTVPSGLRPKAQTAVLISAWSAATTRPVNGFVQTDGKIKIWVDNLPVNNNTQFRMNVTWSTV